MDDLRRRAPDRTEHLHVRLRPTEKQILRVAADFVGTSISELVRHNSLGAARALIAETRDGEQGDS